MAELALPPQDDEGYEEAPAGLAWLFNWIEEQWGEAARDIASQFLIFYVLMLIGFLGLWLMMRSTTRLQEIRKSVARVIREQRERKFDLDDYRQMHGGGFL